MNYDVIVIGAGMSGLAAGIRLAMFNKKVVILEKHSISGGLNSYYQRKNSDAGGIRQFDVGLHALTNFIKKGEKAKPFSKLLKQLRLSYDDFKLCPQTYSKIVFPNIELKFSNDFELLLNEVHEKFPGDMDQFNKLVDVVRTFNELDLNLGYESSRARISAMIKNPLLVEMLLCPLLIYGSAWEEDMDFAQFVIMFKSLYFEGFSRPEGGVRTIVNLLLEKAKVAGCEIRFRAGVSEIMVNDSGKVVGVKLGEEELMAPIILSSAGYPETVKMTPRFPTQILNPKIGPMTFMESIFIFDKKIPSQINDSTITFYNDSSKYSYQAAKNFFDTSSAVVCLPDNYEITKTSGEGVARVTFMSNFDQWRSLAKDEYNEKKEIVAEESLKLIKKLSPGFDGKVLFKDVFSPTTIERYTWHHKGTVYGSTDKTRDGKTPVAGLYIIGTDQGFLGIIGSILSGISMANLHGLMNGGEA